MKIYNEPAGKPQQLLLCKALMFSFCIFTPPTSLLWLSGASGSWGERQFSDSRVSKHLGWICQSSWGIQEATSTSGEALWCAAEVIFNSNVADPLTFISILNICFSCRNDHRPLHWQIQVQRPECENKGVLSAGDSGQLWSKFSVRIFPRCLKSNEIKSIHLCSAPALLDAVSLWNASYSWCHDAMLFSEAVAFTPAILYA